MTTLSLVGSTPASNSGAALGQTTSHTLTLPTGINNGDLIVVIGGNFTTPASKNDVILPSGYTSVSTGDNQNNSTNSYTQNQSIGAKVATSGDSGSNVTFTSSSSYMSAVAMVLRSTVPWTSITSYVATIKGYVSATTLAMPVANVPSNEPSTSAVILCQGVSGNANGLFSASTNSVYYDNESAPEILTIGWLSMTGTGNTPSGNITYTSASNYPQVLYTVAFPSGGTVSLVSATHRSFNFGLKGYRGRGLYSSF